MSTSDSTVPVGRFAVPRRLDDGWDYRPDWRTQQIDEYLAEIAKVTDRKDALQQILFRERDPVLRQGLRFRLHGACAGTAAFSWAVRCARDNTRSGVLSMVKAMVIAGLPRGLIAGELGTDAVDVLKSEVDLLLLGNVNTGDTWHCLNSSVDRP